MAVFLGLLVAASFGSGDFFGGLASRRAATVSVLAIVQICALVGAIVYSLVLGGDATGRDLLLGGGAGALNVVALGLLYAGLATGRMGIVAPLTAIVSACVPVAWGLANGEDLSTVALVGVAIAIASAALIGHEHDEDVRANTRRALVLALGAGFLFGCSFVLYSETGDGSGEWPVLSGRVVSVVLVLAVVAVRRISLRLEDRERRMAMLAGLLDVTATALLLLAVREGLTAVVAPVAALGPAFTVIWAWGVLREPVARVQLVGLVTALIGLAMIAAG